MIGRRPARCLWRPMRHSGPARKLAVRPVSLNPLPATCSLEAAKKVVMEPNERPEREFKFPRSAVSARARGRPKSGPSEGNELTVGGLLLNSGIRAPLEDNSSINNHYLSARHRRRRAVFVGGKLVASCAAKPARRFLMGASVSARNSPISVTFPLAAPAAPPRQTKLPLPLAVSSGRPEVGLAPRSQV